MCILSSPIEIVWEDKSIIVHKRFMSWENLQIVNPKCYFFKELQEISIKKSYNSSSELKNAKTIQSIHFFNF